MQFPTWLNAELTQDPQKLGYAPFIAANADGDLERLLNAPNAAYSVPVQLPIAGVLKWAASGPMQQINDYANAVTNNATLRSICLASLKMFGAADSLDLTDPVINGPSGMLQTLESAGVITAAQLASLLTAGAKSPCSRAEVLGGAGTYITALECAAALGR